MRKRVQEAVSHFLPNFSIDNIGVYGRLYSTDNKTASQLALQTGCVAISKLHSHLQCEINGIRLLKLSRFPRNCICLPFYIELVPYCYDNTPAATLADWYFRYLY